jgi:hypothetical protein
VGYKIFSKVLFRKLEPIGKYRCGFIAGNSTSDQILNFIHIMINTSEYGIKISFAF